jgi:hypothetical protein
LFVVIKLKILKVMKIHGVFESFNLGKIKKIFWKCLAERKGC